MIKREKYTAELEKTLYFCDCCGKEITKISRRYKCKMCKRDICSDCVHIENTTYEWQYSYCHECWNCGIDIRAQIDSLEKQKSLLHFTWKMMCNKRKVDNNESN